MSKLKLLDQSKTLKGQGKSIFTLTFAVEIIRPSTDDADESKVSVEDVDGWVDVDQPIQGCKLTYHLYPGHSYDIDVLVWPHFAKVLLNGSPPQASCMVRTWTFEKRSFVTFSIRHIFTVHVHDLLKFTAEVRPLYGLSSVGHVINSDKPDKVLFNPVPFGSKRYFGEVVKTYIETLEEFLINLIWGTVESHIPTTIMDAVYDAPTVVSDVRHQDTIFRKIQELVLDISQDKPEKVIPPPPSGVVGKGKASDKNEPPPKTFELPGMEILAGAGRLVKFMSSGRRPHDTGEVIVLLSSSNLPAEDDSPIVFVNINDLMQVPTEALRKLRINEVYTRWSLKNYTHESEREPLNNNEDVVKFRDHYAIPLDIEIGSRILASFWDIPFKIEIRGIQGVPKEAKEPCLFGHDPSDRYLSKPIQNVLNVTAQNTDVPIALCTVDLRSLAKGMNGLVRGEYYVNPMPSEIPKLQREEVCTNDINAIRRRIPRQIVPNSVILEAQMSLEVEIGQVGCKIPKLTKSYSRLYCLTDDTISVRNIFLYIAELNDGAAIAKERVKLLTGFAVDLGNKVFMVVEGPKDGFILHVWERCIDYYETMKPVFNSSSRFTERLYPELESATVPFIIMKMYSSLSSFLACPAVYVQPTIPIPARTALLKIGRLVYKKLTDQPSTLDLPSFDDLRSFRLEFCAPPKPLPGAEFIPYSKVELLPDERNKLNPRVGKVIWDN